MKKMTRADFLLFTAALAASVLGLAWLRTAPVAPGREMVVRQHDREVLQKVLTDDGEETWTLGEAGHQNVLQRKGRRVRVVQADCPDQICGKQGWVEKEGDQLVCVPHRLLVEIRSKGAGTIDALAR